MSSYLDENLIFFIQETTKEQVLRSMVDQTMHVAKLPDGENFYKAIIEREKIVSTGIGVGVAFPHAKLSTYSNFFLSIGILQKGVDWSALDGQPVRLVFLIGGPDDKQTEYLKILSSLTTLLRNDALRKSILLTSTTEEVIRLFEAT